MNTSRDCVLGIDLGTSGCRAVAMDPQGTVQAEAAVGLPIPARPCTGCSEQTPDEWWDAVCEVIGKIVAQDPGEISRVCVDGTSSTLLLCDQQGTPLGPALMYDDRRSVTEAGRIADIAPPDSAAQGPGSALAKLLHLLASDTNNKARFALHQADWISARLSGRLGLSDENNALKMGYDVQARAWPGWIDRLGLPDGLLPRVLPAGRPIGNIDPGIARQLGLPHDALIVAGTTDSNAATLAAGCRTTGDAVTSLGSTLVLKVLSDRPVYAARYGVYSHRIGERWLVGGASNSGGAVLRKFFSDVELVELTPLLEPGSPLNLGYYPLLTAGERFPRNDPGLRPQMQPRPGSRVGFLQALLEGIADIEAEGYRRLAALGAPFPRRVLTAGGGAINPAWQAIRSRLIGVPVEKAEHTEAAYGAALLALEANKDQPSA